VLSAIGNSLNIRIHKVIEQETRELIDRWLLERISLAGIARAIPISQPTSKFRRYYQALGIGKSS